MSHTRRFDPDINYYEVLDVPYTATRSEITHSYRQLMRATHPDHFTEEADRKKGEERAKLLNEAYAVLSKPDIRREYDAVMRSRLISDALFQRYTGNSPGQQSAHVAQHRPLSPEMMRAQRQAHRSALTHFLLFVILFIVLLIVVLLFGSVVAEVVHVLITS